MRVGAVVVKQQKGVSDTLVMISFLVWILVIRVCFFGENQLTIYYIFTYLNVSISPVKIL